MTPAQHTLCRPIVRKLEELTASLEPLSELPAATHVVRLCQGALEHFRDENVAVDRPVHVAIVGGSGAGKSELFNAIINQPGASPVSATRRCYTESPVVAVAPASRPKVNRLDELNAKYVDAPRLGRMVLIDTPDLNGDLPRHHEIARQVIERSDLVLFVSIPDQRADFDVLEQLRAFRSRQHWLFVLNKLDREAADVDAIRDDFDRRLQQIGFEPDDQCRFMVSAVEPQRYDLPRLRQMLLSPQPIETVRLSRLDVALGYAQEALSDRSLAPLLEKAATLCDELKQLQNRVQQIYRDALAQPEIQEQLRRLVRDRAWTEAGARVGWPMSMALHLRNRFALFATGYHLTRVATGSVTPFRLVQLALSSLASAARGLLPVMHITELLERNARADLEHVHHATRRILEDHGLPTFSPPPSAPATPSQSPVPVGDRSEDEDEPSPSMRTSLDVRQLPNRIAAATLDETGRRMRSAAQQFVGELRTNSPLIAPLQRALDRAGRAAAGRAIGWVTWVLVNILPLAAIAHVGYRLTDAWIRADYLPGVFYPMALAVLIASFVPGVLWVGFRLRFSGGIPDTAELLQDIRDHPATEPLAEVCTHLESWSRNAPAVRNRVISLRNELTDELAGSFGQSVIRSDASDASQI
ncbi:MAG: GTPase domain-containing protein [Phycisphaeraceae bacterium]